MPPRWEPYDEDFELPSKAHTILVEKAIKYLKSKGFKEEDIKTEYEVPRYEKLKDYEGRGKERELKDDIQIDINKNAKHSDCYYVDVVGVNKDEFVMIECGNVNTEKINFLRKRGEVIIFPYDKKGKSFTVSAIPVSISLRKDQIDYIKNQKREFNFSKFVQEKLDEHINIKEKNTN